MRIGIASAVALAAISVAQPVWAAPPVQPLVPVESLYADAVPGLSTAPTVAAAGCTDSLCGPRFRGSVDYLLWFGKDAPSHYPLLTTGPVAGAGVLGVPGTVPLFGQSDLDFGSFNGLRVTIGADRLYGNLGIEASGFLLDRRTNSYNANTTLTGPLLSRPFVSETGVQTSTAFLVPGLVSTGFFGSFSNRFWGADVNATLSGRETETLSIRGLAGFRYLDLTERLYDATNVYAVASQGNDPAGSYLRQIEDFFCRTQFYGPQVGVSAGWRSGRLRVDGLVKVALGVSHETQIVNGTQLLLTPNEPLSVLPNALFAKLSNIGTSKSDRFAVVPEVGGNVGYDVTDAITVRVGYTFLYLSDVVRPGDQVDPRVNTLFPIGIGPALPAPKFVHSDYWVHGVNFGVSLRY